MAKLLLQARLEDVPGEEIEFETEREGWNIYILHDGTKLKMKSIVANIIRLSELECFLHQQFSISVPGWRHGTLASVLTYHDYKTFHRELWSHWYWGFPRHVPDRLLL